MNFGGPMTLGKMIAPILGDIGRSIKAASDAPARLTVESIDNHVYFYADVDSDRCLSMIRQIREIDIRLRTEQITGDKKKNLMSYCNNDNEKCFEVFKKQIERSMR